MEVTYDEDRMQKMSLLLGKTHFQFSLYVVAAAIKIKYLQPIQANKALQNYN